MNQTNAINNFQTDIDDFAVLESVSRKRITSSDIQLAMIWLLDLNSTETLFTVFDHALLLFMTRSEFWDRANNPAISKQCLTLLHSSWSQLTGSELTNLQKAKIPLLPRHVLKSEDEDVRIVYDTVYFTEARKNSLLAPLTEVKNALSEFTTRLKSSSFWNLKTGAYLAGMVALCLLPFAREIILGAVVGMIGASINEYTVDVGMGHSSTKLAASFRRFGLFGLWSEEINLAHRVHHSKMLVDFRAKFSNEKIRARVDNYLEVEARKMVMSRVADVFAPVPSYDRSGYQRLGTRRHINGVHALVHDDTGGEAASASSFSAPSRKV